VDGQGRRRPPPAQPCATPRPLGRLRRQSQKPPLATPRVRWQGGGQGRHSTGVTNDYRDVPREKTFVACRRTPLCSQLRRYEFRIDGIRMPVTAIVPEGRGTR